MHAKCLQSCHKVLWEHLNWAVNARRYDRAPERYVNVAEYYLKSRGCRRLYCDDLW